MRRAPFRLEIIRSGMNSGQPVAEVAAGNDYPALVPVSSNLTARQT
jgi:hypothetical protein